MKYFSSFVFGVGGAVLASLLWVAATFVLPLFLPYVVGRIRGTGGVSGGYITSGSILLAAVIGFVAGFAWRFLRSA